MLRVQRNIAFPCGCGADGAEMLYIGPSVR